MNELLDWVLSTVHSVDPVLRTALAGLGMLLETSILVGLIVPGDSIVLVASTGVGSVAEWAALVLTVIVGSLSGESIGFAIGRFLGHHLRGSWLGRRIGEHNWVRAENYIDRRGGIAVFLSRFLPVLHSLVPVTVGMSAMRYRRFMAWTVPACVLWAFVYVTVGAVAAGSYRELSDTIHWAGYGFVAVIVLFIILIFVGRTVLSRREARHMLRRGDGDVSTIDPD